MQSKIVASVRAVAFMLCGALLATTGLAQSVAPFNASTLTKLGDHIKYGSYVIYKIGDGIYQINDPGDPAAKGGGLGVDMYLVRGTQKALMIDLGNDYTDGYTKDQIPPRKNASEELRAVAFGLAGKLPLEIAVTHTGPDHSGMTGAFSGNKKVIVWISDKEDLSKPKQQNNIDPSSYTLFTAGKKTWDLGGGRIIETFPIRGHSPGGTVYIDKKDLMLFTGDAFGSGFGQGFRTAETLKQVAEDFPKFVAYITANYTPYERYGLKVYTGHAWQNPYGGMYVSGKPPIEAGYLDWRFIQNMTSCAVGIIQGKWLVPNSGLRWEPGVRDGSNADWPAVGTGYMVYGIGSIVTPLKAAYEAAGIPMPQ